MVDFIVREGKPYLLELTPRPGGDCLPWLIRQSSGLDMLGLTLDIAQGLEITLPAAESWESLVGLRLIAADAGVIKRIDGEPLRRDPRVREVHLKRRNGHRVVLPPKDYDSRILGHVIFKPSGTDERGRRVFGTGIETRCSHGGPGLIETKSVLRKAEEILGRETLVLEDEVLSAYVLSFLEKRDSFMDCCQRHETPLYVFDRRALLDRARKFTAAFEKEIPGFRAFFAMKSNNLPAVSGCLVEFGLGLDVSSGRELDVALGTGCKDILFSGPGKTTAELEKAVNSRDRVTLLLDSFGELERLEQVAAPHGGTVRAGVRLTTEEEGLWRKFGIRLVDLDRFLDKAASSEHVNLCGLQFHTSWNLDPGAQVAFLHRLGERIGSLNQDRRKALEFLDIGGGFWSPLGEWVHFSGTPEGRLVQSVLPHIRPQEHYRLPSQSIDSFARRIAQGLRRMHLPAREVSGVG